MSEPVKKFLCGSVTASVWSNPKIVDEEMVEIPSIRINKSYKDGEEWKYTHSFTVEDLPKVAMVANEVYKYLRLRTFEVEDSSGK